MKLGPTQQKWVDALRSGGYKQTDGCLINYDEHGNASYCCLGVADNLFKLTPDSNENLYGSNYNEILGLRTENGGFSHLIPVDEYGYTELTQMNDDGVPFSKIADFIEANVEAIFTHSV
jgi:hypothetical protein